MKDQKNKTDREQLKSFFTKGSLPSESAFEKLIDSTFNKADDKLDIDEEDGLMIYPSGEKNDKLISFFENIDDQEATWAMSISREKPSGIYIGELNKSKQAASAQEEDKDEAPQPSLFLQKKDGNVGLGTSFPNYKLDVKGIVASQGRIGNYLDDEMDADGEWHNIFKNHREGCNAYEIMAYVEAEGRYSLMHATAVSTLGNSKPKITKTVSYYGKRWNRIAIRWESRKSRISEKQVDENKKIIDISKWWKELMTFLFKRKKDKQYNLQLRTMSNYKDKKIYYKVSVLWNSDFIKSNK